MDACLSRIFALKLSGEPESRSGSPPVVVLSSLTEVCVSWQSPPNVGGARRDVLALTLPRQELKAEGQADPTLDASTLDRALIARLIESPPADYPQAPVQYLLGCYDRTAAELRQAASNPDVQVGAQQSLRVPS